MNPKRMQERGINFSFRKIAILMNYELRFNKQAFRNPNEGYANLVPKKGQITEGILYEIDDTDIAKLDKFEGYPNHYKKETIRVELVNGDKVDALVYIAQSDKIKQKLKPTRGYLNNLLEARDLISENYYNFIKSFKTLDD